jgi:uncharacterized membrane protein
LWKNSEEFAVTSGDDIYRTNSVFVSGKDIYEAGTSRPVSDANNTRAVLWKNGNPQDLSYISNSYSAANSVFVYDNNVYVAGYEYPKNTPTSKAMLWRNGVAQDLGWGMASSVYVFRDYVYVARGSLYSNAAVIPNITVNYDGYTTGTGISISVYVSDDGDVYTAGRRILFTGPLNNAKPTHYYAEFWINGEQQNLSYIEGDGNFANFITVSGDNVYIAGVEDGTAVLWTNGILEKLSEKESSAQSVCVFGKDVYVAGYEYHSPNRATATLWKNGTAIALTDGAIDAQALSVFVVE